MDWDEVTQLLLKKVGDVNVYRADGGRNVPAPMESYYRLRSEFLNQKHDTPLMHAWRLSVTAPPKEDGSHRRITEALLQYARRRRFSDGKTPLMKAVLKGRVEIVELYLRFGGGGLEGDGAPGGQSSGASGATGAHVNEQDKKGRTALMHCLRRASKLDRCSARDPIEVKKVTQTVSLLLAQQGAGGGIDINGPLRNARGQTALDISGMIKHSGLRRTLVDMLRETLRKQGPPA
mmetsp:Transcript_4886/g.13716  ORF Transcript_4886/g.13716 Transcript_4886/m.13716 type:complete len:234 (+) Transcript_4886:99-800(+)